MDALAHSGPRLDGHGAPSLQGANWDSAMLFCPDHFDSNMFVPEFVQTKKEIDETSRWFRRLRCVSSWMAADQPYPPDLLSIRSVAHRRWCLLQAHFLQRANLVCGLPRLPRDDEVDPRPAPMKKAGVLARRRSTPPFGPSLWRETGIPAEASSPSAYHPSLRPRSSRSRLSALDPRPVRSRCRLPCR